MSCASIVARARCSALFTAATDVSSSSAISVACQRSTSARISAARCRGGRCCSAETNARRTVSRSIALSSGRCESGIGWSHTTSRRHVQVLDHRRAGRPEVHRPRAPLAAAQHVEADVRRDPVEPRPQRRAPLEPVVRAPGAHHRLLHRVLGLERRREHAVAVRGQLLAVLLELRADIDLGRHRRRCY